MKTSNVEVWRHVSASGREVGTCGHVVEFRSTCSAGATIVLMSAGEPQIESLSQRELRNESGRVLREVGEGHSFVLTNRGIPVGRIVPLDAPNPTLPIVRHAKRVGGWAALKPAGAENDRPLTQIIDELREDRA